MTRTPLDAGARGFLTLFGEVLRAVRRERGLLQEQLGARAGILGPRIGEIERGNVDTSLSRARAVAAALGLSLSALFRRVEIAAQGEREASAIRDRLVAAIRRLPAEDVDALCGIVERLGRQR